MSLFSELKRRNVLRVAIAYLAASWFLVQLVETLFPVFGLSDALIRLVVIVLAIGFPLVLIFSWLYELTPEGLKLDKDIDHSAPLAHRAGKKFDRAIIVVLTLSLGYFALDKFVLDPGRDAVREATVARQARSDALMESFGDVSIAVLPFLNMSDDTSNEYFSDGISEELLNLLAKIPKLRVISRSSSFSFKGKDINIRDVADQLDVTHVLEGSVRKAGNQVRITVQLIEALSDSHLWSETYERELTNVFAIQDEISVAVVTALKEKLALEIDAAPRVIATTNMAAHEAYLRGRYLVVQRTRPTIEGAIREFENAIALDPNYALAYAELAMAIVIETPYTDPTLAEVVTQIAPYVERAMSLDPTLAESHAAAGWLAVYQRNTEEALSHFERAIQINPNYSVVYTWMAMRQDYMESFAMLQMARRLDPTSIPTLSNYIDSLIARNRLAEADQELEKLAPIAPLSYLSLRGYRLSLGGKWADSVLGHLDALQLDPLSDQKYPLASSFAVIGLAKESLAVVPLPFARTVSYLGISSDFAASIEAALDDGGDANARALIYGPILAAAGNYTRARPLMEYAWQESGLRIVNAFHVENAAALIAIRRSVGDEEGAEEILAAIRDDVRRRRDAGMTATLDPSGSADFADGLADFLSGDRKRGLTLIAQAAEDGYLVFPNEAYLQTLYDDPDFAPIIAGQQARQMRERDRFLAIVCSNNPYEAVWQPEAGTCE